MACTTKPLQDLSKHFLSSTSIPFPTTRNDSLGKKNISFKSEGIKSISNNSGKGGKGDLEVGEFERFGQSSSIPSSTTSTSTTQESLSRFSGAFSKIDVAVDEGDVEDEDDSSEKWNPEYISFQHNSSSTSFPTYSTATYSPSSRPSIAPTFEEAISISSTPPITTPANRIETQSNQSTPPHSLTYCTPSYSAWQFEKLFNSKRRKWYGGNRIPNEEYFDQEIQNTMDVDQGIEGNSGGRGIEWIGSSGLKNEILVGSNEEEEVRRKEVFESLRKVAMSRLRAVGGHFK